MGSSRPPAPTRQALPTYKDIRRQTGLSLATISKYFNGGTVREANRVAIEGAAAELGFRVNELARGLRSRRSRTVGVLVPELNNDFHLSIVDGAESVLREAGIGVLICSSHHRTGRTNGDGGEVDSLLDRQVDGIIAVPTDADSAALKSAARRGVPLVVVDRIVEDLSCDAVVLDNLGASSQVAADLVGHGHRRIAIITGTDEIWTMRQRLAGFGEELQQAGLPLPARYVKRGPLTIETGYNAMSELLRGRVRPSAVFATNYELTLGALNALKESSTAIPDDISFVGFDGADIAKITTPTTTVYTQPVNEFGGAAADLMRHHLESSTPRAPRTLVLQGQYRVGGSVATIGSTTSPS